MFKPTSTTLVPVEFKGTIESVSGDKRDYRVTLDYSVTLIGHYTVTKSSTDGDIINGSTVEFVVVPPHWVDWSKVELILTSEEIEGRKADLKEDAALAHAHAAIDERDAKSAAGLLLASYRNNAAKNAAISNLLLKCGLSLS
jgi:hypothetical protein